MDTNNTPIEDSDSIECPICLDKYSIDEMAKCQANHFICGKCLQLQIKEGFKNCEARDKCPYQGCTCKFPLPELEKFITEEEMKKFDEIESFVSVTIANIPGLRTCWKCAYKGICEDDKCPMECPECSEKTCKKCGKKNHPKRSCDLADINPWRFVESKMSESIIRKCPKCNLHFVKNGGCNHMTCSRCKAEFCYLCGQDITGNAGNHFGEPPKCKQSIDDNLWVEEQIANARAEGIKDFEIPQ